MDSSPQTHKAALTVFDATIPGAHTDANGDNVHFTVSVGGPASATLASRLVLNSELPTVAATAGDPLRLTMPSTSALYLAGLTSLNGAEITL